MFDLLLALSLRLVCLALWVACSLVAAVMLFCLRFLVGFDSDQMTGFGNQIGEVLSNLLRRCLRFRGVLNFQVLKTWWGVNFWWGFFLKLSCSSCWFVFFLCLDTRLFCSTLIECWDSYQLSKKIRRWNSISRSSNFQMKLESLRLLDNFFSNLDC